PQEWPQQRPDARREGGLHRQAIAELRGDDGAAPEALQCLAEQSLALAMSIQVRGIEERDPAVESAPQQSEMARAIRTVKHASDASAADTDRRDGETSRPEAPPRHRLRGATRVRHGHRRWTVDQAGRKMRAS